MRCTQVALRVAAAALTLAASARRQPAIAQETAPGAARAHDARVRFELPPGPAGEAWRARTAESASPALGARGRAWALPSAWDAPDAWREWSECVLAARSAPRGRAELAAAALGQGRDEDAWDHFAAEADGAAQRALLPLFVPGVAPAELERADRGARLSLPSGAVLSPRLPPLPTAAAARVLGTGRLVRREMRAFDVQVGEALFDLRVAIEPEGVQVDLENVRGARAECAVALPEPLDFELVSAYLDWERLAQARDPVAVVLAPGAEPVAVYGRLAPRNVRWPSTFPATLEERSQRHGFALICAPRSPLCARVRGFAVALGRLSGAPAACEELPLGAAGDNARATRLDFSPADDVERKFKALVGRAEQWALTR